MILFSYASPARQWIKQSGTAGHQKQQLSELNREHQGLKRRLRALRDPGALEREARRLGMVRAGERSYVIENCEAGRVGRVGAERLLDPQQLVVLRHSIGA